MLRGNHERNRSLGMPRLSQEENIVIDFKEICVIKRYWIDSAQDRDCWRTS